MCPEISHPRPPISSSQFNTSERVSSVPDTLVDELYGGSAGQSHHRYVDPTSRDVAQADAIVHTIDRTSEYVDTKNESTVDEYDPFAL